MFCTNTLVIFSLVLVLFLSFGGSNASSEDELASTISSTNTTYDLESTTYEYQYDAMPTPDRDLKMVFNAESKLIRNDIIWYDNKGKSLKANRCGSISKTKINGLWYMVGSESSPVWVREKYCSC